MEGLGHADEARLIANVSHLLKELPSADAHHHSAWSKELVGLLLTGLSPEGQQLLCPLSPLTIAAYVRNFDREASLLLHQQYPQNVTRVQSAHKEDEVHKHILTNYGASKSGDKKVGCVEGCVLVGNFSVGSPRDRLLAFRDVPEV